MADWDANLLPIANAVGVCSEMAVMIETAVIAERRRIDLNVI